MSTANPITRAEIAALLAALAALLLLLKLHLLPALIAALLVIALVDALVPGLRVRLLGVEGPRLLAVTLIASLVIAGLVGAGIGIAGVLRSSSESLPELFGRMAQILDDSRSRLPGWLLEYLPADADELRKELVDWLRRHAVTLQLAGQELGRGLAQILIGLVIGALLSLQLVGRSPEQPLSRVIYLRAAHLSLSFRRVVFAQFWISAINTSLTAAYLLIVLPAFDIDLPLVKTLIVVTFVAGLLPILGNLTSNTVIFIVSLSHSLWVALGALAYLVVIHKLEYFLNARIIGSHIQARAWEMLTAMLIMEAAFGIAGLIAAPIFYAYLKHELREKGLV